MGKFKVCRFISTVHILLWTESQGVKKGFMGAISEKEIELEIDEIAMKVEELSAYSGGMLYKEILKRVADVLEINID